MGALRVLSPVVFFFRMRQFFRLIVSSLLEIPDAFPYPAPNLRQLACTKNDQDNDQNYDQFRHAYTKHEYGPPLLGFFDQLLEFF